MGSKVKQHCFMVIDSKDREVVERQRAEKQENASCERNGGKVCFDVFHEISNKSSNPDHRAFAGGEAVARCGTFHWKLLRGAGTSKASPAFKKPQSLYAGMIGIIFFISRCTGSTARFRTLFARRV